MIDTDRITKAVLATGCAPLAMEEGAELAEAWIADPPKIGRILAVEAGWSVRLDELTWAIGVQDLITEETFGVAGNEWKTTKEPGRYWSEEKWLESIKSGPQIAVYALALKEGEFYTGYAVPDVQLVDLPVRIRVRAAVKSAVPQFWPHDEADGWQEFGEEALTAVKNAFIVKADAIRAARKRGMIPWQLMGSHCIAFNRPCAYYDACRVYTYPAITAGFDSDDPAAKHALPFLPEEAKREDAVILSASAYTSYSRCMELGRQDAQSGNSEESLALQTGTVFHAAVAEYYRQVKESQNAESNGL